MPGANNTSIGKSSRRPTSISNIMTSFDNMLKLPKFPVGPTTLNPGPILLKVAITDESYPNLQSELKLPGQIHILQDNKVLP